MRVASRAARNLTSGGSSEVATTRMALRMPSGPSSSSMNSRTSRPRSPTSASTTTSAAVPRAIIPSSVDLPTPLPPKMPRRCPRPVVQKVSMTLTPVWIGVSILTRSRGDGAAAASWTDSPGAAGPPSSGRPRPSIVRPMSSAERSTVIPPDSTITRSPRPMPRVSPKSRAWAPLSSRDTTSACLRPRAVSMRNASPTLSRRPPTAMPLGLTWVTLPVADQVGAVSSAGSRSARAVLM